MKRIFRYVDDYLVVLESDAEDFMTSASSVLALVSECLKPLQLTHELPVENSLKFLDLRLNFTAGHICWCYEPRASKPLLPFASNHTKLVKRGIIASCLRNSLRKSCLHSTESSFFAQTTRLVSAGYPRHMLDSVARVLLREMKRGDQQGQAIKKKKDKLVVVPYMHKVGHNLKKIGMRAGVDVVFSAPNKLSKLCMLVNADGNKKEGCAKRHGERFVDCEEGIVYSLPLSCGKRYIGQSGRCINDRLREHKNLVGKTAISGHLSMHCRTCACEPLFGQCSVIGKEKDKLTREVIEAYEIDRQKDSCVSAPSVTLSTKEIEFLNGNMS